MTGQKSSSAWIVWVGIGCVVAAGLGVVGLAVLMVGAGAWTATRATEQARQRAVMAEEQARALAEEQAAERRHAVENAAAAREALMRRAEDDARRAAEVARADSNEDGGTRGSRRRGTGDDPLEGLDDL